MKRKKEKSGVAAVCQLRNGDLHPFGAMRPEQLSVEQFVQLTNDIKARQQ